MLMSAHPDNKGDTFSVTPDGRKVDEHIHGPILDNEEAESGLDDEFLRRLEERGYSKEHIDAERKLIEEKRKRPKQARGGKVRTYTMPLKKGKSQATISSNISTTLYRVQARRADLTVPQLPTRSSVRR